MTYQRLNSCFSLLVASVLAVNAHAQEKPNIVFMMTDNLGYGDVGVYGGGELRGAPTTRIDSLAREGLRFTQDRARAEVDSTDGADG